MIKKTLEQYQQDFSVIDYKRNVEWTKFYIWLFDNIHYCDQLLKDCIADYPEEDLGYIEYGKYAADISTRIDRSEYKELVTEKMNEFKAVTKKNKLAAKSFVENANKFGSILYVPYIYREKTENFKDNYFLCGDFLCEDRYFSEAAEEFKVYNELGGDYKDFIGMINPSLESFTIENKHCIKNLTIKNIKNCYEIYFLGENGVGKTLLLQSMVSDKLYEPYEAPPYIHSYPNLFAYGTARYREGWENDKDFDRTGQETLFDRDVLLVNPLTWLEFVRLKDKAKESPISIHTIIKFLNNIINFDKKNEFELKLENTKFVFTERGTKNIQFEHLAEGYRTVLILLCDLLYRLTKNQPYINDLKDFYGVVLIDEIDMFLHPKWEYKIVSKLREELPGIQWFFTTHSPMLILGASEDAVFYKLYKNKDGETQISEQMKCKDFDNLLSNALITSPLFDMDTARMNSFAKSNKELDTSRDYVESRLRIKIDEKISNLKKTHQTINRSEIDALIDQTIDELTNTAAE